MDLLATLPAFLLAVVLISASPGPAMVLIFRRAAVRGAKAAVPTVLGLELGIYAWAIAAGAGLAALVAASEAAYLVLRVIGAGFLILLGMRAWWGVWRERSGGLADAYADQTDERLPSARAAFGEGLMVQLANPKAAIFMFAFYPQFVPSDGHVLGWTALLAAIQVMVETSLYLGLALMVGRASAWFSRSTVRRWMELLSGTVLVGLGLRVATSAR